MARHADVIAAMTLEVLKGTTRAFDKGRVRATDFTLWLCCCPVIIFLNSVVVVVVIAVTCVTVIVFLISNQLEYLVKNVVIKLQTVAHTRVIG